MPDRFDTFTERARRVLTLAQAEAQRLHHNYIGTEHLLLGLVREGEGVAAKVLANLGVELNKVRSAVELIIGGGRPVAGEIGLTPPAKKVIELAVDEARRLHHSYIGTEHLLLGLVREGEGVAAGAMESLGVTLENVRAEVKRILRPTTPMPATIIDGKAIAAQVRAEVAQRVAALKEQRGVTPGLAVVLVGGDPASVSYVRAKGQAAEEVGIFSQTFHLPAETPQSEVLELIARLNADERIHAMLVQLPLPSHLDEQAITAAVDPQKDADALHPVNVGRLFKGEPYLLPCTPAGIVELLVRTGHPPDGKHVVICGRSNLVGRPLAAILIQKRKGANATVTVCHTGTRDLARFTRQADILVAAMGAPRVITADMVRPGAVVIDVGVNRVEDTGRKSGYRLVGDVDFEPVARVAAAITPVPGGVGPMTVAMLLANTVAAAEAQTVVEEVPHDR